MHAACSSSRLLGGGLSALVHAGITPGVWAWRPPGCGPGDPPSQIPQLLPWVWAWRPARYAGIPPPPPETWKACWDTIPSPCEQNYWHTLLKILPCPKLRLRAVTMGVIYLHREFILNKYDQYFIKILLIAWHRLMSPAGLDSTYCIKFRLLQWPWPIQVIQNIVRQRIKLAYDVWNCT